MMTCFTKVLVAFILPLLSQPFSLVMAVDRTKFRTCSNSSFCRRNRNGRNQPMYSYRILSNSLMIHKNDDDNKKNNDSEEHQMSEEVDGTEEIERGRLGGYYQKIKRLLSQENDPVTKDSTFPPQIPFLTATLENTSSLKALKEERLDLHLYFYQNGVLRMKITEQYGSSEATKEPRWTSDDLILNLDEMIRMDKNDLILLQGNDLEQMKQGIGIARDDDVVIVEYLNQSMILVMHVEKFALHLYRKKDIFLEDESSNRNHDILPIVSVNSDSLMHFEIRRKKDEAGNGVKNDGADSTVTYTSTSSNINEESDRHGGKEIVGYWEDGLAIYADGTREERKEVKVESIDDVPSQGRQLLESNQGFQPDTEGLWEEKFNEFTDTKPYGPMSVGMDISFPSSSFLYGLPEHASSTKLLSTVGANSHYKEPYRLYNLDVFEYELDETMALYGEVPLIVNQNAKAGTTGVFWFNPTETFVDIDIQDSGSSKSHWISESGIIDLFLLPGPSPREMYAQYASLTGRTPIPPIFSLGYHQCRWNYRDEKDVLEVHGKFEELDYPYDVLWLDIEHTDEKKYFTWDYSLFPNPKSLQEKLKSQGRNMVTIVDPHIKRDDKYYIHKQASSKGLYIKDKTGKSDYDGWCWPGSSSYLDFTNAVVRQWWGDQFAYDKYEGSSPSLYIWNDMNEPSVFNGPEVSMQKDLRNLDGVEHREWHNLFGILFHRSTAEGLIRRNHDENVRPFVLSRSFFAGSQRHGAIWTGDNESSWEHLAIAAPMLLSLNIAALSFVGADVGGFFGNPDAELMTRWMQAGAYQPFFRGHAHHDSKRREPWVFGDEWMHRMRRATMARYALLPYWYTTFYEASVSGMPVMRTMWMEYPENEDLYDVDDQYLIGKDLLVKPVTARGITESTVLFPTKDTWYDVDTMLKVPMESIDKTVSISVESDIEKIPVFQRGGSIIPRKLRLRRSTETMKRDPYSLYVALNKSHHASGKLYMDDENSFDHERFGHFIEASFQVDMDASIKCSCKGNRDWIKDANDFMIERIIIMGVKQSPLSVSLDGHDLEFLFDQKKQAVVIKKPNVSAISDWEINLK
jgi:mannosyl-oligosaccharide alpha-1,3-glucosidase